MKVFVFVLLLAAPVFAQTDEAHPRLTHALIALAPNLGAIDLTLTEALLARGGFREGNLVLAPFAGNPLALGVVKSAITAGTTLAILKLHDDPHPVRRRLAYVLLVAQYSLNTYAIVHNARLLRRETR